MEGGVIVRWVELVGWVEGGVRLGEWKVGLAVGPYRLCCSIIYILFPS